MSARQLVVIGAALAAACSEKPSKLDPVMEASGASSPDDPWAASGLSSQLALGSSAEGGGLGFDLEGMLAKLKESLEKPGPYEAPETSKDYDAAKPHWGVLRLGGDVVERESYSWTGGRGTELRTLIDRLRTLAADATLRGLVVRAGDLAISLPDVIELRAAMHDFRAAGKQLACHVESAANATYLVLAACDRIALAPVGQIAVTGPAAMPIHVKPLLDKVGVTADFLHVGSYKGAAEPLTRDAPSAEMRETLGAILDRSYETMVEVIAAERKLDAGRVRGLIDTALFSSEQAVAAQLVDEVSSFEVFRDRIVDGAAWGKVEIEADGDDSLAAMLKLARFIGAMPPEKPLGDHVAIVYALGNIVDGRGDGILGARQQIASHTLVPALRAIAADDTVKAVVLRIDSGGGSAQASELIWREVAELVAKKPVIVSMSDVAASGGYYIASNATKIFALDNTLTGSIGVVGGKIAPAGALAKLGVNTFPMGRGKRATMMASLGPWNAEEKQVIQDSMESVYRTFVGRVAEGRNMKLGEVLPIAQGRVWTGTRAKELGLVDEIGGLDAALAEARKLAKLDATTGLEIYPPAPTLRDFLKSFGGVQTSIGATAGDALASLGAVDPALAREAARLVELALSFRSTAVQAIAVLPVIR